MNAEGTASDLKATVGSGRIDVIVDELVDLDSAARILASVTGITAQPEVDRTARRVSVAAPDASSAEDNRASAADKESAAV